MSKVIAHIDLNAFFVRCEELKNPLLIGKPVAIGHDGRCGIVSTCSYKAREYGVRSGMPMYQAKKLCDKLIVIEDDYHFYAAKSNEFINVIHGFTNVIEQMSVDECFADFTSQFNEVNDAESYFKNIQNVLFEKTGLNCSIGVAPTKFLAKMGSDYKKPNGLTIIRRRDIKKIIFPLDVSNTFGIGKKTYPKLKKMGINTIGDLYEWICNNKNESDVLGKSIFAYKDLLEGKGDDVVNVEKEEQKSIGCSSTFMHDTTDVYEVEKKLKSISERISKKMKRENKLSSNLTLVFKNPSFQTFNKSIKLTELTNDSSVIAKNAISLFKKEFSNKEVRLVGITMTNLVDPKFNNIQMSLFNYEEHEDENATKLIIEYINKKLKKNVLTRASSLKGNNNGNN